ncbi:MAG: hypothetical protein AB1489_08975 [Acidobacteriota bacterium]
MKRSILTISLSFLLMTLVAPLSYAQSASTSTQEVAKEETEAEVYKVWYQANDSKDYAKAMELAQAYLKKFPTGQYSDYMKKWVVDTRARLFNQARDAKKIAEEIRLGQEALVSEPENIDYLYLLAVDLRTHELSASPPNYTHAKEASDFTQRVIKLIEADKIPNVVPKEKWNKNLSLAFFYHTLATIEKNKQNLDTAIEYNNKSIALDQQSPIYLLTGGSYHQEKYQLASKKLNALPEQDRKLPEVKTTLDELNSEADVIIELWAKFLALTVNNSAYGATRKEVEQITTTLYQYRHPDTPNGLEELIKKYTPSTNPEKSSTPK